MEATTSVSLNKPLVFSLSTNRRICRANSFSSAISVKGKITDRLYTQLPSILIQRIIEFLRFSFVSMVLFSKRKLKTA